MRRIPAAALVAVLVGAGLAAATGAHGATAGGSGTAGAWRQANADANADHFNPGETTLRPKTVASLGRTASVNTTRQPPTDACASFAQTAPLVSGKHIFDLGGGAINEFSAASGRRLRHINLLAPDSIVWSTLLLHAGIIVASGLDCDSVSDPNGYIVAYNVGSGTKLWEFSQPGVTSDGESDGVVVASGGTVGSGDQIAAINLQSGATLWTTYVSCFEGNTIVASGLVVADICPAGNDGPGPLELDGFDLHTGTLTWRHNGAWGPRLATSDVAPSFIYTVKGGNNQPVGVFDAINGEHVLRLPSADLPLAADATRVYATCGARGVHLCAFDETTSDKLWVIHYESTPAGQGVSSASASVAGGVLYLDDGRAFNAQTGVRITRFWDPPSNPTAPIVGRGIAVVPAPRPNAGLYVYGRGSSALRASG